MLATAISYTRPHLYAKQAEFVDSPSRYTVVEASTKTGKTVACLVWLFEEALKGKAGQHYWWVAPTYSVAGIAFGRLKIWLATSDLPRGIWRAREAEQAIEIGGRVIWFKGGDKPDLLYGEDVYAAVMDEATRCKPEAWHAVRTTLTATRGPVKIIGNVRGRKNWAYLMARKGQSGQKNFGYFKLTAYDAVEGGVLAMEEVEDARRTLPPDVFKQLYLAEPADDGGNPFGLAAIEACTVDGLSPRTPTAFGVDLAKSQDWTVVCGLDDAGAVCLLERWQSDWGQTRRRVVDLIGDIPALIDSTGVGDPIVEDMRRERSSAEGLKFTSTSKQQLMEGLAAAIQRGEVSFPQGWLTTELETFEYEYTRGGVKYTAPEGLHDDGVCALALAVAAVNRPRMAVEMGGGYVGAL
jgi:phage FluMu gp28-like protein